MSLASIADRAWQIRPRALPDAITATGQPRRISKSTGSAYGDGLLSCSCGKPKSAQAYHCRPCSVKLRPRRRASHGGQAL